MSSNSSAPEPPASNLRLALAIPCRRLALSTVGKDRTPSEGGLYYVGAAGWVAFCVLLLATLVFSLVVGVRTIGRTSSSTARSSS